jgi:hypothetical protein
MSPHTTPKSKTLLASPPEEVLKMILAYLEGTSLKRCRLGSRQLNRIAPPFLFARLTVDCYHLRLHDLMTLARSEHLALLVQEIIFDISDLSVRGLLHRVKRIYSRSTSKCHNRPLAILKDGRKMLDVMKPYDDLLHADPEDGNFFTTALPHMESAFMSCTALRSVRIVDGISEQRQSKPLLRGAFLTCFGVGMPLLHFQDHRLRSLLLYRFQTGFLLPFSKLCS